MSELALSWETKGKLREAGYIRDLAPVAEFVSTLPPKSNRELKKLLDGKAGLADKLERELAALWVGRFETNQPFKSPLREGMIELTHAVIARQPGQNKLVPGGSGDEDDARQYLIEYLMKSKHEWESWPQERLRRYELLMRAETLLLDDDPKAKDHADKEAELAGIMSLLPEYPATG
jgi:hypothetical protein